MSTQNTCTFGHKRRRHETRSHKAFVHFCSALSPGEHDWLLRGGRRGLATGAGQKNSRLFTFSLQLSLSTLPPPPTFLSSSILNICIGFQRPSDDVGQRHNYPARAASRVFFVLMPSKNVDGRTPNKQLWQEESCMQFTVADTVIWNQAPKHMWTCRHAHRHTERLMFLLIHGIRCAMKIQHFQHPGYKGWAGG